MHNSIFPCFENLLIKVLFLSYQIVGFDYYCFLKKNYQQFNGLQKSAKSSFVKYYQMSFYDFQKLALTCIFYLISMDFFYMINEKKSRYFLLQFMI